MRSLRKDKGMVTVEACLAFPIFLCFFLLLMFLIKLTCIDLALEHTANETAKQLASSAYPVKFLNELEDETFLSDTDYNIPAFESELQKAKANMRESLGEESANIFSRLLAGNSENIGYSTIEEFFRSVISKESAELKAGARGYITSKLGDNYYEFKSKTKYAAAKTVAEKFIEGSYLKKDKLEYIMVQLPQSTVEQDRRSRDAAYLDTCKSIGYVPEKDDVVVALEYDVKIPVPFFRDKIIQLKHVGIERAWLKGSNGIYSKDIITEAGSGNESSGNGESTVEDSYRRLNEDTVYITKTGTKYHKYDCPCLSASKIPIGREEAENKGYGICGVCSNKGKWNFYK